MEYVDGEGAPAARAGIEAHLATCPSCQALAAEQRGQARILSAWKVDPAPETLDAPQRRSALAAITTWRPSRVAVAVLSSAACLLMLASYQVHRMAEPARNRVQTISLEAGRGAAEGRLAFGKGSAAGSPPPDMAARIAVPDTVRGPAVIRTATLQLIAKDFPHARSAVELILDSTGGFADQLGVSADPGSARVLRGTLRVPGGRLTDVLTRLRALGEVTQDQQNAQDVADQLVDLDARIRNARATEQRLSDLLKNRTGRLTDVLEVEQQITRVRLDIERLDAERTNMTRRVAYATVDLTISEERKTAAVGPLPLLTQIRIAAADGLQHVVDTVVAITLFALRSGPSFLLWGSFAAALWIGATRFRRRGAGSPA